MNPKGGTSNSNNSISTTPNITKSGSYSVQIAAFSGDKIPVNIIDKLYGLSELRTFKLNGYTKYTSGVFKTYAEATIHKTELEAKGFTDCFVTPLPANNSKVNFNN